MYLPERRGARILSARGTGNRQRRPRRIRPEEFVEFGREAAKRLADAQHVASPEGDVRAHIGPREALIGEEDGPVVIPVANNTT
jgi:hypothetical protein